jgi:hypothetical protein
MGEMTSQEEWDEEQLKHDVKRKEALSKAGRRPWSNNNNRNFWGNFEKYILTAQVLTLRI